jgi:hypothetical protein
MRSVSPTQSGGPDSRLAMQLRDRAGGEASVSGQLAVVPARLAEGIGFRGDVRQSEQLLRWANKRLSSR